MCVCVCVYVCVCVFIHKERNADILFYLKLVLLALFTIIFETHQITIKHSV